MSDAARRHVAIALVAAALILLQVALTRLLSVLLWYHWAFFAVSLAMLGVGAPGAWLALRPPRDGARLLERSLLVSALGLPLGVLAIVHGTWHLAEHAILLCLASLLPGVLGLGTAVCWLLIDAPGPAIGRRYACDLLGACLGALLVVPALWIVPTPELCAGTGLLPLAALGALGPRRPGLAAAAALVLLASLVDGSAYRIRHSKAYREVASMTPIFERWTPTGRIAIFDRFMPTGPLAFRWGLGRPARSDAPVPVQYWLEQDGSAGTPITRFTGELAGLDYLLDDVTSVGYQLRRPDRVAIVGAGGGRDILTALLAGARHVDAIELNAAIVEAVQGELGGFSGGVYEREGVEAIVGEGRSVLTRSNGGYDLIQISMIDSWAATAAGAYTLSENNLYTVEAYRLYLARLSPRGVVATSRWMPNAGFGLEIFRLLSVVGAALRAEGALDPVDHVALLSGGPVGTVLMSKVPLGDAERQALARIAGSRGFRTHALGGAADPPSRLLRGEISRVEGTGISLAPPTDDAPFFFQPFSPFRAVDSDAAQKLGVSGAAVVALRRLMVAMALLTLALFFSPFLLRRWLARGPGFWRGSGFFACIGLSFLLVEIAWLQRFVLYLGHPSLAATAVLGCVLLGAGLGSLASIRIGLARWQRWGWVAAAGIGIQSAALAPIFQASLGWPFAARLAAAALLVAPPAFAMGLFLPLGMLRFGDERKAWYWALNGAAGVLASALSLGLSMELGFSRVAQAGAGLYALAWWLLRPGRGPATGRLSPAWAAGAAAWAVLGCGGGGDAVGTLERDRLELVAEANEPIAEIAVREGDAVAAGELLVRLSGDRFAALVARSEGARDRAAARLAELERGPRAEQIAEARARLAGAEGSLSTARNELERSRSLVGSGVASLARLDRDRALFDEALARRDAVRAELAALLEGTTSEELDQARAALAEAESALADVRLRASRLEVRAPVAGRVDALPYEPGERPPRGASVAVLLTDGAPYARVYVPEALRVRVVPGVAARVRVDGLAEPFEGRVRTIASEASFTPYHALTERDRGRLVFVAEVDLTGEGARELPTGVPVQVEFALE